MKNILWMNVMLLLGIMLSADSGRAEENAAPQTIDFAGLFKKAATAGAAERIIVADDFEQGISQHVTRDPVGKETGYQYDAPSPRLRAILAVVDPAGIAGLKEATDQAASGSKSIRLEDSLSATPPLAPALSWWLYGQDQPVSGQLRIAFDILVPEKEGSTLEVSARDQTDTRRNKAKNQQTHFVLRCSAGLMQLNSARLPVSKGEWVHCELVLPLSDATGKVRLTVTNPRNGIQSIEQPPVDGPANRVNWIGMALPGQSDGHVYLDNLVITNSANDRQSTQ
jgi:hypothetical protein